ncbi:MAG: hypothetical protein JWL76_2214 [Thermoleophilia bacterium]|nr:hypothetical protein [Thermoleophilia bacterium]
MRNKGKYAAIGYVVSKFVLPVAKRQAKKSAKRKAKGAVTGTANVAKRHPARTSVAVGAAAGAIGWLATRGRRNGGTSSGDDA